jgi:hypothetical protein
MGAHRFTDGLWEESWWSSHTLTRGILYLSTQWIDDGWHVVILSAVKSTVNRTKTPFLR